MYNICITVKKKIRSLVKVRECITVCVVVVIYSWNIMYCIIVITASQARATAAGERNGRSAQ